MNLVWGSIAVDFIRMFSCPIGVPVEEDWLQFSESLEDIVTIL